MGFELLLPVVLFILTLVIIFLLRSDDRRNQRTDLIRKRSQALLKTVENSHTQFNESAQKIEERISKKIDESRLLMSHIDSQLTDLEARSEDLAALQKVLTTYQTALTQLETTTTQVEQRVVVMRGEVASLNRVEESLSDFDLRFEQFKGTLEKQISEGEENIRNQHLRVRETQSAAFAKLQEYEKEVQQAEQDNLALIATHTETLKNRQEASLNLVSVQATKLRQLSDEGEQQMLQYEKALQASYKQANENMQEQQREAVQLQSKHAEQQKRHKEELQSIEEEALRRITEQMQSFVRQSYSEMGTIFDMTLSKTDLSFQNMIRVVSEYLKELSLRLEQARGVTELLGATEHASLLSFKEDLSIVLEETLKGEQDLKKLQALEDQASSALSLLHKEAGTLQDSLARMKTEKLALLKKAENEGPPQSVVFAMTLVDEACKPLEKEQASPTEEPSILDEPSEEQEKKADLVLEEETLEPLVKEVVADLPRTDESLPLVVKSEEPKHGKAEPRQKSNKKKQDDVPDKETQPAAENRRVEYLTESEEEEIVLDEGDEVSPIA